MPLTSTMKQSWFSGTYVPLYSAKQLSHSPMQFNYVCAKSIATGALFPISSTTPLRSYLSSLSAKLCNSFGSHDSTNWLDCSTTCSAAMFSFAPNKPAYRFWWCLPLVFCSEMHCKTFTIIAYSPKQEMIARSTNHFFTSSGTYPRSSRCTHSEYAIRKKFMVVKWSPW